MTKPSIATILQAFNEEILTGSIFLRTSQHVDRVIIIDDGFTNRTARAEGSEITVRPIRKEPQINTDEHRYNYNNSINIFQRGHSTTNLLTHFPEVPGCKKCMDEVVVVDDGNTDATREVYA